MRSRCFTAAETSIYRPLGEAAAGGTTLISTLQVDVPKIEIEPSTVHRVPPRKAMVSQQIELPLDPLPLMFPSLSPATRSGSSQVAASGCTHDFRWHPKRKGANVVA